MEMNEQSTGTVRTLMYEVRHENGDVRLVTSEYIVAKVLKSPSDYIAQAYYVRAEPST